MAQCQTAHEHPALVAKVFPNHADAIKTFGTWQWYAAKYGMQENGRIDLTEQQEPMDQDAIK